MGKVGRVEIDRRLLWLLLLFLFPFLLLLCATGWWQGRRGLLDVLLLLGEHGASVARVRGRRPRTPPRSRPRRRPPGASDPRKPPDVAWKARRSSSTPHLLFCSLLLSVLLRSHQLALPLPPEFQLDWEAIFTASPTDFVERVRVRASFAPSRTRFSLCLLLVFPSPPNHPPPSSPLRPSSRPQPLVFGTTVAEVGLTGASSIPALGRRIDADAVPSVRSVAVRLRDAIALLALGAE